MLAAPLLALSPAIFSFAQDLDLDLAALAKPLVEGEVVPGLVVAWTTPEGSGELGLGRLSREDERAPDGSTVFEIGSITKTMTALLLARAVERGELALDLELSDVLPDGLVLPRSVPPVRLEHLATHTAGFHEIPTNLARDYSRFVVDYSQYGEDRLRAYLSGFAPATPPGTSFRYSNAGFGVLGWVLAERSGLGFGELLRRDVGSPLELRDTFLEPDAERALRLATGHDPNGDPVPPSDFACLVGCGGVRATARDLLAYLAAHVEPSGELAGALRLVQEPRFRGDAGPTVALGWLVAGDGTSLFHDGQTAGHSAFAFFDATHRRAAVVLANGSTTRVADLGLRVMRRLAGQPVEPPPIRLAAPIDGERLERLEGVYANPFGITLTVTRADERLYARILGQAAFRVLPDDEGRFFYRDIEAELAFDESTAPAPSVTLFQNGRELVYRRRD